MNTLLQLATMCIGLALTACATLPSGWSEYRSAIKCDLQNKGKECDGMYESAIKENPKLPGVYSSYGAHLYNGGEFALANENFQKEIRQNPEASTSVQIVLDKKTTASIDSSH